MTFSSLPISASKKTQKSGSALLLTILVVSLLLVIVLSFVVYVRMELRTVVARQQLSQARANAKLGIELALGRLQHLAGPDTRTTATADVLRGDLGNLYRPGLTRSQVKRNWVGIWDGATFDEYDPTQKDFLGWLVSGVEDTLADASTALSADTVSILSSDQVVATDVVEAPLVNLENGRYAYWVSDEGVKARFDLLDPYRGSADNQEQLFSLRSAQRVGAEILTYNGSRTLDEDGLYPLGDEDFLAAVDRLVEPDQLPLLGATGSATQTAYQEFLRRRTHDVTVHSEGLLTDSQNGGLKRDLSLVFEMPLDDFNDSEFAAGSPNAELPAYQPSGYPAGQEIAPIFTITDFSPYGFSPENSPDEDGNYVIPPKVRGPNWHFFRNFYRMYKPLDPDRDAYDQEESIYTISGGEKVYKGRGLWPKLAAYSVARRFGQDLNVWDYAFSWNSNVWPLGRPMIPSVSPVPTRLQAVMSIQSVPSTTTPNRVLELYMDPVFTIINPYNAPLSTGEPNGQPLQVSIRYQDVGFEMQVRDSTGTRTLRRNLRDILNTSSSGYSWKNDETYMMDLIVPSGFVMEPGEVVLFSGSGDRVLYQRQETSTAVSGVELVLEPGVTASLPTQSGVYFDNMWQMEFEPDAEIRTRLYVPHNETKLLVSGVNRTGSDSEPFFDSFVANARNVESNWSNWISLNTPALTNEKRPLVIYDASLKSQDSTDPINMLTHFNIRADSFSQGSTWDIESQAYYEPGTNGKEDLWWGEWVSVNSWDGTWLSNSGRNGYWGGSNTAAGGERFVTLFDLPTEPVQSIASLQHAQATFMPDEPTMVIGNSFAPIFVHKDYPLDLQPLNANNIMVDDNLTGSPNFRGQWTMTRVDWSYLLNQNLWDGYFFSGIAPNDTTGQDASQRFTAFQSGVPLAQSTLIHQPAAGTSDQEVFDALFTSSDEIQPEAYRRSASHLRVQGMFNVNSTSVEAWRALLASTRNAALNVQGASTAQTPGGTLFTRTLNPENVENEVWKGFRSLTDAELTQLAQEIVRQVQVRGPFLNMSDFINRRLRPSGHPSQTMGPLQAAIEAAGLNSHVSETLDDAGMNLSDLNPFVRDRIDPNTPVAMGATGYLTQADLLTVLGPLLSNRSDTFVIRAYGETEAGGARSWCEAVVQRTTDYVDSSGNQNFDPAVVPLDTGSYDTVTPRRRFKVISFRWMNEEDV